MSHISSRPVTITVVPTSRRQASRTVAKASGSRSFSAGGELPSCSRSRARGTGRPAGRAPPDRRNRAGPARTWSSSALTAPVRSAMRPRNSRRLALELVIGQVLEAGLVAWMASTIGWIFLTSRSNRVPKTFVSQRLKHLRPNITRAGGWPRPPRRAPSSGWSGPAALGRESSVAEISMRRHRDARGPARAAPGPRSPARANTTTIRQPRQGLGLAPLEQVPRRIGADQEREALPRLARREQPGAYRRCRTARAGPARPARGAKRGLAGDGQHHHPAARPRRGASMLARLEGLLPRRDEAQLVQAQGLCRRLGDDQVTVMDGVERPAEEADGIGVAGGRGRALR